jgi:hypothetical protein
LCIASQWILTFVKFALWSSSQCQNVVASSCGGDCIFLVAWKRSEHHCISHWKNPRAFCVATNPNSKLFSDPNLSENDWMTQKFATQKAREWCRGPFHEFLAKFGRTKSLPPCSAVWGGTFFNGPCFVGFILASAILHWLRPGKCIGIWK